MFRSNRRYHAPHNVILDGDDHACSTSRDLHRDEILFAGVTRHILTPESISHHRHQCRM
jgi:hypothetical protein